MLYLLSNLKLFGIFIKLKCILPPYLAVPNQQRRKNEAKPAPVLVREAIKENEPERMPPPPALKGRRKSVAPQELNKGNKRLSCVVKPPDMQTKRGKVRDIYYFYFF